MKKRSILTVMLFASGILLAPAADADFAAGTGILQKDLSTSAIENVDSGDEVAVRTGGGLGSSIVQATLAQPFTGRLLKVTTSRGHELTVSGTQPFLLSDGTYRLAGNLKAGDMLVDISNQQPVVIRVESIQIDGSPIFNLWLETQHVPLFANGVAVGDYQKQVEMMEDNDNDGGNGQSSGGCSVAGLTDTASGDRPVDMIAAHFFILAYLVVLRSVGRGRG